MTLNQGQGQWKWYRIVEVNDGFKHGKYEKNWLKSLHVMINVAALPRKTYRFLTVCLLGCLTSQQHANVSQGRICSDNFTCCHTETEVADPTFHLTLSQYTDTGPISPSTDPITPGVWQGSQWSANFYVTGMTQPQKNPSASRIQIRNLLLSRRMPQPLGQWGGDSLQNDWSMLTTIVTLRHEMSRNVPSLLLQ